MKPVSTRTSSRRSLIRLAAPLLLIVLAADVIIAIVGVRAFSEVPPGGKARIFLSAMIWGVTILAITVALAWIGTRLRREEAWLLVPLSVLGYLGTLSIWLIIVTVEEYFIRVDDITVD